MDIVNQLGLRQMNIMRTMMKFMKEKVMRNIKMKKNFINLLLNMKKIVKIEFKKLKFNLEVSCH